MSAAEGRVRDWLLSVAAAMVLVFVVVALVALSRGDFLDAGLSAALAGCGVLVWRWRRAQLRS